MELDFSKICRICLNEGVMMSIFKVNISKKMMACASVQVWQNDGLPNQICNKCSAKLHISFQFKKQCEKSDAKLRQYLYSLSQKEKNQDSVNNPISQQPQEMQQQCPAQETLEKVDDLNHINHLASSELQTNCVYIDCGTMLHVDQNQKFDNFVQPPVTQINYNISHQNAIPVGSYNLQGVGQVQVYNGTYTMPVQPMQPAGTLLHNHVINHGQPETQVQTVMPNNLVPPSQQEEKDKSTKVAQAKKPKTEESKQCNTCNKVFASAAKLSRHVKTHWTDMPYKCKTCNKSFSHSGNYKIHLRMHTDERPFQCLVCNKGCRQAQDLEKHMRTHTGERPHKCHVCPRAFSTSSNLIAHIRIHTGEKPYVCCVCQKAFCQSNELTKHMRTHTGEKSHICDICHKGFNGSSTLIVHRRSHTGERPYVCSVCSKGFTQSSCLASHMKRHNGHKSFSCVQCAGTFITRGELKEHELKEHLVSHEVLLDKQEFQGTCDKNFSQSGGFSKQVESHTGESDS